MRFKKWFELQEVGTSTSCVAGFARMAIPQVRRMWPPPIASELEPEDGKKKKSKKPYMQPQVQEGIDSTHTA